MPTENRHITRIETTETLFRANGDHGQSAILSDVNDDWAYWNAAKNKMYYGANQYYWNGAAITYCDVEFNEIEAHSDIFIDEYIKRSAGTDDNIRFENDKITIAAGGVDAFIFEDDRVYTALNVGIGTTAPNTMFDVNGVINTLTGYRIANVATSGDYLRGNGTNFVSSAIQISDIAHNLFSTTHGDTTGAASPIDGDIIIGNVTPKWSKLSISIPAAGTCNYLGVNNGELRPSWESSSANPGAAASILQTTTAGLLTLKDLAITTATTMTSATWIGLGAAKGKITFTDAATDTITFDDCFIGIGTIIPNHLLTLQTYAQPVVGLYATHTNAAYRNWAIITNYSQSGDFVVRQGNARGDNPISSGISRFYIDPNGRLCVGDIAPECLVHLYAGAHGGMVVANAFSLLCLEDNDSCAFQFLTPNNKENRIYFGDQDNGETGRIIYNHSTDFLTFYAVSTNLITMGGSKLDIGFFGATFDGNSGEKTIAIKNALASPSAHIDDQIYMYSKDSTFNAAQGHNDGATLAFFLETDLIIAPSLIAPTHCFPIWINGTEVYVLCNIPV